MRFFAMTCLIFLCVHTCFAKPLTGTSFGFDVKKANQKFDRITLQLSVQNLNFNNLDTAVNTLTNLTTRADQCVEEMQKKLNNIDLLIKQGNGSIDDTKEGADLVYLNNQHKELAEQQAQCRLFSIRAKEAIEAYKNAIAQLKQEETLTRGMPLWKIINQTIDSPPETKFISMLTTKIPATLPSLLSWIIIICAALVGSTILLLRVRKSWFASHYLRFKALHIHHILLLAAFFISGVICTYLLIFSQDLTSIELPLMLSGLVFFYLLSLVITCFIFRMKKIRAIFIWYSLEKTFFQSLAITLLSFYFATLIGQAFASSFNTNSPLWQLCQTVFLIIILSTTAYFIYYFCQLHRHLNFIKSHYQLIQRLSLLVLLCCAIITTLGYHTLAQHLTLSGFLTFCIVFVTLLITQSINKFYLMLSQQQTTKIKLIKYFGYGADQVFTEFLILKTVVQLLVFAVSIYLIGQSWGFATDYIQTVYNLILYGVPLANVTVYPTRIVSGVVVFCVLYLVFRAISTYISSYQQFEDEEETQVAVASILTYIGFGLALIAGFLVAGFDFTGLAIIAGALSVGIGLGLQSIVNNFVSGLILLIEKPIRPGDRISVDGVEGYVKKIRVRSTQLITATREDIIVPNSDLITRQVTNYMFSDRHCGINCEVGVAYGSDTHQVRDILIDIANNHEEVIKNNRNKPVVLFRSFGDNNLIFQLCCLIKDVNKKQIVASDLNFAVEKAFREYKIDMAFPQRDVHLKIDELDKVNKNFD